MTNFVSTFMISFYMIKKPNLKREVDKYSSNPLSVAIG